MKTIHSIMVCSSLTVAVFFSAGCYKDNRETMFPTGNCDTSNVTWAKDIKPIINNSCATSGCHDAASSSAGYNFSTYSGVKTMVNNNRFLAVIESGSMPKNAPKLDDCSINKVRRWINTGSLEN